MKYVLAIATALLIGTGAHDAAAAKSKTVPNGPSELIGTYGSSPTQCRSYHRKADNLTFITSTYMVSCGGSWCEATIVSHQKLPDGYILNFISKNNPSGWSDRVRVLDRNVIEVTSLFALLTPEQRRPVTLVRCTKADAIAGIGLRPNSEDSLTKSLDGVFAAYYALAVPSQCEGVEVNTKAAEAIVDAGRLLWTEFLLKRPWHNSDSGRRLTTPEGIAETIASQKRNAEYAVRADAKEIKEFCSEVLNAFGDGGRILPNLLRDPRRKA